MVERRRSVLLLGCQLYSWEYVQLIMMAVSKITAGIER
jgi:hypothetical protein